MKPNFPIDLVVLWVNGNDPNFIKARNNWALRLGEKITPARFVQTEELKYVFRSVEKYLPWITRVVLVTNGQPVPSWLNKGHPRLKILTHAEFMPPDCLPVFNSCAIGVSVVLWPGLSEHFLVANDDTFVWRPLSPSYFFKRGKAVNRFVEYAHKDYTSTAYGRQLLRMLALLENNFPCETFPLEPFHNIGGYIKSGCLEAWQYFSKELTCTRSSRFRQETNMNLFLFAGVSAVLGKAIWKHSRCSCLLGSDGMVWELWQDYAKQLKKYRPKLVCLNDSDVCCDADRKKAVSFLEKQFPFPSSFENESR